ncbi:MAG: hypothetical protein K5917_00910 [Clostridiales bacterium]|nr:hypothetical protein [Clostridiales bacterium]
MNKEFKYSDILISFMFSTVLIFVFLAYCDFVAEPNFDVLLTKAFSRLFSMKIWLAIFLFFVIFFIYRKHFKIINDFIFHYRFAIVFAIFALCVFFEITGSSIGMWCAYLGEADNDVVLGVSRPIRTDEWAVSTPIAISQYYNYSGSFPYFSDTVRAAATDVFLVSGTAVKNPLIFFRPFYWGYLFLPVAKGMAFFWCGRLLALLLVSFEFGMLITNRNKSLSVVMAIMIAYAPAVQWWFYGFAELLIYTQLSVLCLKKYLNENLLVKRICLLAVIVICAGGYVLTFYPPWMIPCVYVLLALILWVLLENYKDCRMRLIDWICIAIAILVFMLSMLYLYQKSKGTIQALMNTVYPGERFETGGGGLNSLFLYITNIWHSVLGEGAVANVCESSYFIDFFPICWLLPIAALNKKEDKDVLSMFLFLVSLFLGVYCVFGFPRTLARFTLLRNAATGRAIVIFGFCNILLLIRSVSINKKYSISLQSSIVIALVFLLIALQACKALNPHYLYKSKKILMSTIAVFFGLYFCLLSFNKNNLFFLWKCGTVILVLFASFLANPIRHGIKSVENISLLRTMKEIHLHEPDAKWMIEGEGIPFNLGLFVGIPTVNSTNIYPNIERWRGFDSERKYEQIYNRYANCIIMHLIDQDELMTFSLPGTDFFACNLNMDAARQLDVSYIMTRGDLTPFVYNGDVTFITMTNGCAFYKVNASKK